MDKKRLKHLARFLLTGHIPGKFSLDRWWNGVEKQPRCKTTACAVGWATTLPSFRKAGLSMDFEDYMPQYKTHFGFSAVAAFFEISYAEATFLFDNRAYTKSHRGRRDVARRINKFVETNGANCPYIDY